MLPVARRMITREKGRFAITALGVGMIVMLILLLFGMSEGVRTEANGYVRDRPVDLWLCQKNCTNLIRSSSLVDGMLEASIRAHPAVVGITPLLRLIGTSRIAGRRATFFVLGFDPTAPEARPTIVAGTAALRPHEMVVDRALAAKYRIGLGDSIAVQGRWFTVRGISEGTNAVITQFAFVPMGDAERLLGFGGIVSYWLVRLRPGSSAAAVAADLAARHPELSAFTRREFEENNLDEMRTGLLPILLTVAILGALVGAVVLMLLLYTHVLEHRLEYAVLKAIGAGQPVLAGIVLRQSLLAVFAGLIAGTALSLAGAPVLRYAVPEIALSLTWRVGLVTLGATVLIGIIGAWLPVHRLARIYPAEVFRA